LHRDGLYGGNPTRMKRVDRWLQQWRIHQAARWIPEQARLIDVGAFHGELFHFLGSKLHSGFGVEPLLKTPTKSAVYVIESGFFPEVRPTVGSWDAITMLAVLEHIPDQEHSVITDACYELLRPGGRVIITVPSRVVDHILACLKFLHLIDGMSLEEHHGFKPHHTEHISSEPRFRLVQHSRFQIGLNHLFVFEKTNKEWANIDR
jgi:SAM-dependent methyltransferase